MSLYESVGEHGVYNITAIGSASDTSLSAVQIFTVVEPDEPLLALIGWACFLLFVIFLSFYGERLYAHCHQNWVRGGLDTGRVEGPDADDEKNYYSVGDDGGTRSALLTPLTPATPGTPGMEATWASKESFSDSVNGVDGMGAGAGG